MSARKPPSHLALSTRERVLAAAESLLAERTAEFSMRDLAAAAGVSFATPFNQFGDKLSIMRALSAARIDQMHERAAAAELSADATERVLEVVAIAVGVMIENPAVNRAVMGAIGAPGTTAGDIRERSRALWAAALGDGTGLMKEHLALARSVLPEQLANAFRGVLSFWTAGEVRDQDLRAEALAAAATLLLGFSASTRRDRLIVLMAASSR
ncbi:TetR/AcrR family transcriptional regulator [Ancylobacter radicis]|uniref:TetR family transcriptional regulator n=1 Tax=Ancylobacter radicis TaxID=2836179 RepID=A0ABS5R5V5_9HYPH|nr:TetR family transcriptional regulator [Ancylobacter radicis]MBS9476887.1 TetR family transcriptional regulator [Ancylobacter radicis]